jgi:hypothetical protein
VRRGANVDGDAASGTQFDPAAVWALLDALLG